ncbi:hypothetical protein AVEN_15555-1 [Araneus ventricosus]|uniref:Uncharacterized protein n=1 Tax=Araneus ventricosus TaxID=182803 RepID=A0A4Y2FUF9_ARAVE|nr:hypothetical protein AVEN_15555-1 [Araneus ventricosus]
MVRKAQSECFFFFQREIEHFECCDEDFITSHAQSDEDIVSLIKEKKDLIDDSSSDMEDEGDASSGPSISDAVDILQNFFATETVDKNVTDSFLIIDKQILVMYLKSRCFQQKKSQLIFIL